MNPEKERKKPKQFNYIAVSILLAVILGVVTEGVIYRLKHTFSTEKWLNNPDERTAIVDDLMKKYELVGMNAQEVTALLGEHGKDLDGLSDDIRYTYYLGPEKGFISIDSEWLILIFKDGVVSECYVMTD